MNKFLDFDQKKRPIIKRLFIIFCFLMLAREVFLQCQIARANSSVLSVTEQKIARYIVEQQDAQLTLLEKLVNINSGTENITGIHQVGKILQNSFDHLGFETRWIEQPAYMSHAGTLIAQHNGGTGKRLLLIGHLDTVFPINHSFQKFKRQKDIATGPGIIDDKGGCVVMLYALQALQAVNALKDVNITVVLTGDEEDSGKPISVSRKPLFDVAYHSDVALDFEWAMTPDTATVARRGILRWVLKTEGNAVHSANIFQKSAGYGAIFELTRILDAMRTKLSAEKYLSFNPGIILGGMSVSENRKNSGNSESVVFGKDNVIAKIAIATGDIRFLTVSQKEKTKKNIVALVKQHLMGTTASISFQEGIPAMSPIVGNLILLKKYSDASEDLGYGTIKALDPSIRGAADISYIASIVPANLAGLGALGTGAHSEKETLEISALPIQTQRAALLIYRLTHFT